MLVLAILHSIWTWGLVWSSKHTPKPYHATFAFSYIGATLRFPPKYFLLMLSIHSMRNLLQREICGVTRYECQRKREMWSNKI